MILIMIMLSILKGLIDFPGENIVAGLAGISGWIAGIFVFIDAPRTLKIQASILILMGVILSTFALTRGQMLIKLLPFEVSTGVTLILFFGSNCREISAVPG